MQELFRGVKAGRKAHRLTELVKEIDKQKIREVGEQLFLPVNRHNSTPRSLVLTFSRWRCWALACCFACSSSLRMEAFSLSPGSCGKLPEGRRDNVGIPALEEHQIARYLAAGVLFQCEVNAVLLGGGRKGPDVLVGDLDVGNAGVVLHQLPEGLLAVVQLGLVAGHSFLHLVQHFFHGLLQHPGGELGGLHAEGNGALGNFFLHE